MKKSILTGIFLFAFLMQGIPQIGLVLKNNRNGSELVIRKGKRIAIVGEKTSGEPGIVEVSGKLVSFTDSSLTLDIGSPTKPRTVSFHSFNAVKYEKSVAGNMIAFTIGSLGVVSIIYSPWSGAKAESPYKFAMFATALGYGLFYTAAGIMMIYPAFDYYSIAGVCKSRNERFLRNGNGTYYFSLANGFGPSYGGIGFRAQARFGKLMGVGIHLGGGWEFPYPVDSLNTINISNRFSLLGGLKFFPYRGWYVDVQFGNFGKIATVVHDGINNDMVRNVRTPYGFVFTAGGDWIWGKHFGMNLGAGIALDLTSPQSSNTFPVFDMGFIIKL